jgi:hypothetical protein
MRVRLAVGFQNGLHQIVDNNHVEEIQRTLKNN